MPELSDVNPNLEADISAKQRRFEESELLLSLYKALIENRDLGAGLRAALEIVCEFTSWIAATIRPRCWHPLPSVAAPKR